MWAILSALRLRSVMSVKVRRNPPFGSEWCAPRARCRSAARARTAPAQSTRRPLDEAADLRLDHGMVVVELAARALIRQHFLELRATAEQVFRQPEQLDDLPVDQRDVLSASTTMIPWFMWSSVSSSSSDFSRARASLACSSLRACSSRALVAEADRDPDQDEHRQSRSDARGRRTGCANSRRTRDARPGRPK